MSESSPAQLGPYTPQQLLSSGAQASVWIATGKSDPGATNGAGKQVALKVPRGEDGRQRLLRESKLLGSLDHPNLIRKVDAAADGTWLALERVPGVTIDQWSHGRPVDDILGAGLQLVSVLDYLHTRGLVHGDLKPASLLVTAGGHLCLAELGLAAGGGAATDGFRGTLGYAAPEVLSGRQANRATDLYGLGAVLYCCLTGRAPFSAPDPAALTYLPLVSLPSPPAAWRPEIAALLNQLLLGLLARDPGRRPSDLEKVTEVLRRSREQPFGTPVLGMAEEREELRRAVVGAADGETRVVVVYGVPGSGRRTLIAEAVEHARREGLPYLKADPPTVLASLRSGANERPPVVVMKAAHSGARHLAEVVLAEKRRCLLLLHADRPVPGLAPPSAIHLTPAPLEMHDAARLVRLYQADPALADGWWRQSMGLPAAILARIRAWRRTQGLSVQQDSRLPVEAQKIYDALHARHETAMPVEQLAVEVGMTEHQLLDHCEVLFAEDLVQATDDGRALRTT